MHRLFSFFLSVTIIFQPFSVFADIKKWSLEEWNKLYQRPLLPQTKKGNFLFGTGVSEHQVSGSDNCPHSNWAAWETKDMHGSHPTIHNHERSGKACDFWNVWKDDIARMQELETNSFRFSVEWSAIEPVEGEFCQEAIQHYSDMVDELLKAGIKPNITLHHFTHPQWFEEKGGWEVEANNKYFTRFCEHVFNKLSGQASPDKILWVTFNEIGPFVFEGYIEGVFPPGKTMALRSAATVMRNMLKAHCDVYRTLKALPNGQEAQIGLVHQYAPFETYSVWPTGSIKTSAGLGALVAGCLAAQGKDISTLVGNEKYIHKSLGIAKNIGLFGLAISAIYTLMNANLLEKIPVIFMNYVFNDAMIHFLKTGTLFPWIPGLRMTIEDAPQSFDFIGVNGYSRMVMRSRACDAVCGKKAPLPEFPIVYPSGKDGEYMTSMPYAICPEALYEGIVEMAKLGKPIYVTENGAPDTHDTYRGFYIKQHLYALSKALYDGYDVRGYYYWSLLDNFEWNRGYSQKFGLYDVNMQTQKRTLKKGAEVYRDAVHAALNIHSAKAA